MSTKDRIWLFVILSLAVGPGANIAIEAAKFFTLVFQRSLAGG